MVLVGDITVQGDNLAINLVHNTILSLVGSKQVIFFTRIPNCLKLVTASALFKLYFFSLPEIKNKGPVWSTVSTVILGNIFGILEEVLTKDIVYLLN